MSKGIKLVGVSLSSNDERNQEQGRTRTAYLGHIVSITNSINDFG